MGVGEVGGGNLQHPHTPPNLTGPWPPPPAPGVPFWSLHGVSHPYPTPKPSGSVEAAETHQILALRLCGAGGVGSVLGKKMEKNKAFLLRDSLFSQWLLEI